MDSVGFAFIKAREGCVLYAYKDSGGVITIGYGNTSYYGKDIQMGMVITQEEAEKLFKWSLTWDENTVRKSLTRNVSQNEYNALVSLCYNSGVIDASFMKKVNSQIITENDWTSYRIRDRRGIILPGLINRRKEEFALYKS